MSPTDHETEAVRDAQRDAIALMAAVVDGGGCDLLGLQSLLLGLGLATWAPYDPALHGDVGDIEPGTEILAYSDSLKAALGIGRERLAARYRKAKH